MSEQEGSRRKVAGLWWWATASCLLLLGGGTAAVGNAASGGAGGAGTASTRPSPTPSNCGNCQGNSGNGGGNGGGAVGGDGGGSGPGNPGHPVTVTGVVAGHLVPGVPATLTVTVENPNNQPIVVTTVTGAITAVTSAGLAGHPVCDKNWYALGSFTGSKAIARNSTGTVALPVTFLNLPTTNQDNCKGSTYSFTFTATANQA